MQPDEIKKWLEPEEIEFLGSLPKDGLILKHLYPILESLAESREHSERRRVLLKKHERADRNHSGYSGRRKCAECGAEEHYDHKPDCAWGAALKGEGGEEK